MFNLIRRISGSVIPRTDRPWEDDPTSNAPQTGRKRRLSSIDRDHDQGQEERSSKKKVRGESVTTTVEEVDEAGRESSSTPLPRKKDTETEEVKEVTKGVNEVDLEDTEKAAPESVPLPAAEFGELDDVDVVPTPPPETQVETQESIVDEASSIQNAPETTKDTSAVTVEGDTLAGNGEGGGVDAAPSVVQKSISKESAAVEMGSPKKLRGKSRTSKKVDNLDRE